MVLIVSILVLLLSAIRFVFLFLRVLLLSYHEFGGRVKALYGLVGLIDVLYGCRDSSNVLYPLLLGMTWYDVLNLLNA